MTSSNIKDIQKDIDDKNKYISDKYSRKTLDHMSVEEYLKDIVSQSKAISYSKGLFQAFSTLSVYYLSRDLYEKGYKYLSQAKGLIDSQEIDESEYPQIYNYYLIYYAESSHHMEKAIECYQLGSNYAKKYNNQRLLMVLKSNFAVINITNKNYEISRKLLLELIAYYKANGDERSLMPAYENIGNIYLETKQIEEAKVYYSRAYNLSYKYHNAYVLRETTEGLTKVYLMENDTESAVEILKKSLAYGENNGYIRIVIECKIELSRIFFNNKENKKALNELLLIKNDVDGLNSGIISQNYYKLLSEVSSENGDYKMAYVSYRKYHEYEKDIDINKGEKINEKLIHNEYDQTIKQLKTIAEIGKDIAAKNTLDDVLVEIVERLRDVMKIDAIGIGCINGEFIEFNHFMLQEVKGQVFKIPLYSVTTLSAWVVNNNKDLVINDLDRDFNKYIEEVERIPVPVENMQERKLKIQSVMYMPLKVQQETIGVFTIQSIDKNAYASTDYEIYRIISSYVAIALKNVMQAKDLLEMTIRDSLTGLYNRRGFTEFYDSLSNKKKRMIKNSAMVMLDLDFFKKVNDEYGHIVGDNVLIEVGKTLLLASEAILYPARLGGEEFGFIILNKSFEDVCNIAEYVRKRIEAIEIKEGNVRLPITSSIGVAYNEEADIVQYNKMYQKADNMLYQAKDEGRNRVLAIKV